MQQQNPMAALKKNLNTVKPQWKTHELGITSETQLLVNLEESKLLWVTCKEVFSGNPTI